MYFADESGFTLQPYIPYAWQKKGKYQRLFARNKKNRLNVLGFMSLDNRLVCYHTEKTIDAAFIEQSLKDFFKHRQDPQKPIVIVWDNGPVHHAKSLKANFEYWESLDRYFFFLPKYSPHLNPIEILWRRIKYTWLSKKDYKSWTILKKAIFDRFKRFGSDFCLDFKQLISNNMTFNSA